MWGTERVLSSARFCGRTVYNEYQCVLFVLIKLYVHIPESVIITSWATCSFGRPLSAYGVIRVIQERLTRVKNSNSYRLIASKVDKGHTSLIHHHIFCCREGVALLCSVKFRLIIKRSYLLLIFCSLIKSYKSVGNIIARL